MKHQSHPDIIKRLKRAHGHLAAVLAMFADERPCLELAQQLNAIEGAVHNAKRELIQDHIAHCLEDGHKADAHSALRDLKQLAKFL
jgi:hypothetical protein NreA